MKTYITLHFNAGLGIVVQSLFKIPSKNANNIDCSFKLSLVMTKN